MTIAFDAFSHNSGSGASVTVSHTPVGTPRGVIVYGLQLDLGTAQTVSATYGGVAMTAVSGSPNAKATGEGTVVYGFFLGSGLPTGVQNAVFNSDGAATVEVGVITVTATNDTVVIDTDVTINSDSSANPTCTLNISSRKAFCAIGFVSGQNSPASTSPTANWTSQHEQGSGTEVAGTYTYDTIGTSDVAAGWTQTAEDAVAIAVAIGENLIPGIAPAFATTAVTRGALIAGQTGGGDYKLLAIGASGTYLKSDGSDPSWVDPTAAQSDQETATSTILYVTPGRQQFHPGHPKCWGKATNSAGTPTLQVSYNITSITDTATDQLTVTIATDFSTTNYAMQVSLEAATNTLSATTTSLTCFIRNGTLAAGSFIVQACEFDVGAATDPASWHWTGCGDQA